MEYPWMVEAKKYVGLKEIPGPKHNSTILKWLNELKAWWSDDEQPWCFTGETEIFTENGWVRLDMFTPDQRVYQADEDGKLTLTYVIKKIEKDYNGDVFSINNRSIKLICDVGHRWWGLHGRRHKFNTFDTLENIEKHKHNYLIIPNVYSGNEGCGLTKDQLWLLAAFISDGKNRYSSSKYRLEGGSPSNIEFEVSRQRKIDALTKLNPDHVYMQKKIYNPRTKTPLTVFTFKYPTFFNNCFDGYKSLSNQFINSMSQEDAKTFIEAYTTFDGNGDTTNASLIYTSDEKNRDKLISIITLAGYHSSQRINPWGSLLTKKLAHVISFSPTKKGKLIQSKHIERMKFQGKLYCVQVPQGRIVVRGQTGGPVVTGNCGTFLGHCFYSCGLTIPKYYMRAKAWSDGWGIKIDKPIPGCVVVFDREGGGHVSFVVGINSKGNLICLGGNQGNMVKYSPFSTDRVVGYFVPKDYPNINYTEKLAVIDNTEALSTNEA